MTITDIALADREASDAREDVDRTEADLGSGRKHVTADALHRIRDRMRHADLAAAAAREKAEQQRSAARSAALRELGRQIGETAAEAGSDVADALEEAASWIAKARARAAAWDARVADLKAGAVELGARGPVPGGCRRADEGICVTADTVRHETTVLAALSPQLGAAIAYAVGGDLVSARAAIGPVRTASVPQRADRYFRGRGGVILPLDGDLTDNQAMQVRNGDLVELSESQIRAYLDGETLQADHYLQARGGGAVIHVFGDVSAHQAQLLRNGILSELSPSEVVTYLAGGAA